MAHNDIGVKVLTGEGGGMASPSKYGIAYDEMAAANRWAKKYQREATLSV